MTVMEESMLVVKFHKKEWQEKPIAGCKYLLKILHPSHNNSCIKTIFKHKIIFETRVLRKKISLIIHVKNADFYITVILFQNLFNTYFWYVDSIMGDADGASRKFKLTYCA